MFEFEPVERHKVVAGSMAESSDAGGLLLGRLDRMDPSSCFTDRRDVTTADRNRAYEDLNDHDELRHDP